MLKNLKYNADKSGLHKKIKVVENKKRMLLILLLMQKLEKLKKIFSSC